MQYQLFKCHLTNEIIQKYHVNSLMAKVIEFNQYDDAFIASLLNDRLIYHDFSLFEDADLTLDRIEEAIENNEKICIYGDYDCDGIMATTILVQAFKELGVEVGYHIPNRFKDGYGLNTTRARQIAEKGYSLIITVDNGITAFEAIDLANTLGVDVIVSDHHSLKETLPDACSIVHTQISYDYPFKEICGAFVAYKLAAALLEHQDKYLYSLAAIATLSDVMPLVDENRSIVKKSLRFMNEEKYQPLELLIGNNKEYTTQSLNFTVIPKINSIGRLPELCNPNILVRYFLKDCPASLRFEIATKCEEINNKRKSLTSSSMAKIPYNGESFVYYSSDELHRGILGLIAGRMTSTYKVPSFIMYYDKENKQYIGSCRSVNGYSIKELFLKNDDLFLHCGGHDLAGGFTIEESQYENFHSLLNNDLQNFILKDETSVLEINEEDLTIPNIESLSLLAPFGNANNEPLFCLNNVQILSKIPLQNGKHLKMHCKVGHVEFDSLLFNIKDEVISDSMNLLGHININNYRNMKNINFIIQDMI